MKDFIITHKSKVSKSSKETAIKLTNDWWFTCDRAHYNEHSLTGARIIIIGDYLGSVEAFFRVADNEIPKLRGHFYAIIVRDNAIKIYNSLFSMLPLYYCDSHCFISSSIQLIKQHHKEVSINKKYILENLLFNYGFFNRTLYTHIQLVPCHHFMTLRNNKIKLSKHFSVQDLFVLFPEKGDKVIQEVSDLFIETSKHYFPDRPFSIAFTSGFDGRTLVSCASFHQKNFTTFSFGRPENDDVQIPLRNAEELQIPYTYFDLGDTAYTTKEYYKNAIEYTTTGYMGNGFLYPHFLFSTQQIATQSDVFISGAAGSELFRALHNPGAVTSQALVALFKYKDEQEIRQAIKQAKPLQALHMPAFENELEELIEELLTYKRNLPKELSPNQQFYIFVFEEIFRKFFGQWIATQRHYTAVRTPFLDYTFIKKLLATAYAGANNDFFTDNPIKRMKGQLIYADIIRKTNSTIYHQKTGKGYRPIDVRDPKYITNIILHFVRKRMQKKVQKTYLDNLGIISGIKASEKEVTTLIRSNHPLFNTPLLAELYHKLTPYTPEKERDTLLMSLSLLHNLLSPPTNTKTLENELYNSTH